MYLKTGSYGKDVLELKVLLNNYFKRQVLDPKNPNFGLSTYGFVVKFQQEVGLNPDGIVGDLTYDRLKNNGYEAQKVKTGSAIVEELIRTAKSQLGVKEKTGKNDGIEVEKYLKSVGLPKGYAWCQAFVYWVFLTTYEKLKLKNPVPKTAGVLAAWNQSKKYQLKKGTPPERGDVFTMNFGKGTGHAGIVTEVIGDYIYTIEGNTSADPTSAVDDREGQGTYQRRRKISTINNGFLRYTIS